MMSARYTFVHSAKGLSGLMDEVNEFCRKYPEYRMFQVMADKSTLAAILTTDPN